MPPAVAPRGWRSHGRLLLPEQRRHRRPGLPRPGRRKVAILDVDYHHGNGTRDIFYNRNDVFFASIHGDPRDEFPFFLGYADETGEGAGQGCNINYPLPAGSDWAARATPRRTLASVSPPMTPTCW